MAYRLLASALILTFQNCECERDLAVLRKIRERGRGQWGDERIDQRARILLQGPEAVKTRLGQPDPFAQEICREWCAQRRRHSQPCATRVVGPQGRMPQRAPHRGAGKNREAIEARICGEAAAGGVPVEEELTRPELMCEFLKVPKD